MKKTVKTSVIIPVYNEKVYLDKCLDALKAQEVPVGEIIVVDNNTDDGSVEAAKKKHSDVIFLEEKEQGIVFARNTGFDHASGEILIKLDADSITHARWHTDLLETIGSLDGWTGYVDNDELNKYLQPVVNWLFNFFTFQMNTLVSGTTFMFGSNLALTKEAWNEIKDDLHMRNDIWEDLDISLAMKHHRMHVGMSTFRGAKVSARSANAPIKRFYMRLYGHTRVFILRELWIRVPLSIAFTHISFLIWLVLKPLSFIGQTINERSRPEQY